MPLIDTYPPGTFCWAELGTSDASAATRFYTTLFGWSAEGRPTGSVAVYTVLHSLGRSVAALYRRDAGPHGPPHWLSYIAVTSAGAAAERARGLGGAVLMEPFDVLDVGRMAMVQDPSGAVVALWEARCHAGAGVSGEPNSICWHELLTTDPARAQAFYGGLFDWDTHAPQPCVERTLFSAAGAPRGGMAAIAPAWGVVQPHWLVHIGVRDCDGATALAQSLGGTVRVPPADADGVGRRAVLADPEGAVFAVATPLPAARPVAG